MSTAPIIGDNDVKPVIFREYIGVKGSLDNFPANIIDPHTPEFHFILGFALETYVDGKGTGTFEAKWNTDSFSREKVDELKKKHPNVKVVISIGARDTEYAFHPAKNAYWCDNAVNSLKEILQIYTIPNSSYNLIDGIDINYEYIHRDVSEDNFSYYIGDVIKRLKQDVGINVVSIAPWNETQKHYKKLYKDYTNDINLVNYQFYIDTLNSKDEFVNLFRNLSSLYEQDSKKLLAGASTDPADAGEGRLSRDDFLEGCVDLHSTQSLRGIFIWNADDSAHNEKPFSLEKKAQEILNN